MSRVLVTGGSGFIGLPTLAALVRHGEEVHAVSSRPTPPEVPGVHWHQADLGDERATDRLVSDLSPERLVHLAWYVEHGRFWEAPENLVWVERSIRLVRAFARCGGRRAVMLGTCAEYDWSTADGPLHETASPIRPTTLYGVAKDALRRICCVYAELEHFGFAWGRLFFLYGPREAPGRLVSSVIRSLLAGEDIQTTAGAQRRDFLHVDDVAQAIVELLDSGAIGPVNIASGTSASVAEVIDRIALVIGRPELVQRGALPTCVGEPPVLVADVSRLRDEVGFRPHVDLPDGIAHTVAWWRARLPAAAPAIGNQS
jgi:nucleoside-diphosphate-sugar epimerase